MKLVPAEIVTSKVEVVNIKVDSASKTKFAFPQNLAVLERGKITCIEAYSVTQQPTSTDSNAGVNTTAFNKAGLTLSIKGKEQVAKMPLYTLNPANFSGRRQLFDKLEIDFAKSFVSVPTSTGLVANEDFIFVIHYED